MPNARISNNTTQSQRFISEDSSQYENTRPTFRLCPLNLSRKKSIRSSCIKQSKYLPQKYSPSSIILIRYTKRINVMNGWITIFFMNWWFPDENADYKTPSCQFHQYLSNCVLNVYKFWYQMIFFKKIIVIQKWVQSRIVWKKYW